MARSCEIPHACLKTTQCQRQMAPFAASGWSNRCPTSHPRRCRIHARTVHGRSTGSSSTWRPCAGKGNRRVHRIGMHIWRQGFRRRSRLRRTNRHLSAWTSPTKSVPRWPTTGGAHRDSAGLTSKARPDLRYLSARTGAAVGRDTSLAVRSSSNRSARRIRRHSATTCIAHPASCTSTSGSPRSEDQCCRCCTGTLPNARHRFQCYRNH